MNCWAEIAVPAMVVTVTGTGPATGPGGALREARSPPPRPDPERR